jgi:hypothetical protein
LRFKRVTEGLILVALSITLLSLPSSSLAQQNDAISAAQTNLIQCYNAAKSAEYEGANISQLTIKLNTAGLLLSRSQLAYSKGDFESASNLAVQSQNELVDFVSDANSLKILASQSRTYNFLLNVVGSIFGTVTVLIGSFAVWRSLKRKYGVNGATDQ